MDRGLSGCEWKVAQGFADRARGLAFLDRERAPGGLLIPRCRSVHTFGMRFELDVYFLSADGSVISVRRGVPPRRIVWQRDAAAVLEVPRGNGV